MCIILGDGRQYFMQLFMPSAFTGNRIEGENCITNIDIRITGKPIEHGHANQSQKYTGKVEIPIHSILSTGKQKRYR